MSESVVVTDDLISLIRSSGMPESELRADELDMILKYDGPPMTGIVALIAEWSLRVPAELMLRIDEFLDHDEDWDDLVAHQRTLPKAD